MDAVVLAGGYATRLWPITIHRPKMLLPVGSETVIDRILSGLESDDRIDTVYVSTNERFAEGFEMHLRESRFEKPVLSVEETIDETEKLGVIGALAQLVDREHIDDELLVVAGDNLISFELSEFIDFYEQKEGSALVTYDVGSLDEARSYGIVELDDDRVVDFQEKPTSPASTQAAIACYAFRASDVRFEEYLNGDNNPDEPGWYLEWLQSREPVYAFPFAGAWFDIGTPENYLRAVKWVLDGECIVEDTASVIDSTIGSNVHVMADCTIENSTLDNSLVFDGAVIRNCDLKNSIVDTEAMISDLTLEDALIGAHSSIP